MDRQRCSLYKLADFKNLPSQIERFDFKLGNTKYDGGGTGRLIGFGRFKKKYGIV
jgi:hypothetical protein